MGFTEAVRRGVRIVKLERPVYREVASDPHAFTPAMLIVALAGLAAWLAPPSYAPFGIILSPIGMLLLFAVGAALVHFMAILFGGQGDLLTLARVWGTGWVIGWATVVPVLGTLVLAVWSVVMGVVAVEEIYGLDRSRAILTLLVPFSALLLLGLILGLSIALITGFKGLLG